MGSRKGERFVLYMRKAWFFLEKGTKEKMCDYPGEKFEETSQNLKET